MSHDDIKPIQDMTPDECRAMGMAFNNVRIAAMHFGAAIADALRATQDDFTLTGGFRQSDNEAVAPLESKELPHD